MKRATLLGILLLATLCLPWHSATAGVAATVPGDKATAKGPAAPPVAGAKRTPWTTSHLTGSPEPPPPFRSQRVFPKLVFNNPLLITSAPGTNRLFVAEHSGKVYSFTPDQSCAKPDLFLDPMKELVTLKDPKITGVDTVYGLAFHPNFAKNHYCYLCYALNGKGGEQLPEGTRVSRFKVSAQGPPRVDPKSEAIIITWLAGGHNGGNLKFGPDGYLYISTGDGSSPNPPDALDTGQDLTDLLSSILRIDVDHADKGKAYRVPPDNPFLTTPKARPEIWAYGFRNPWQMSFDRATGDLWVGDVGWELWEMAYKVERGGNYGWPVMEGPQPVKPQGKHGPTPILPPTIAFPHTEAASITGGYVYRGKCLKDLVGAYICGDWATRTMWATRFDGKKRLWHKTIAQTDQRIVAFAEDHEGELYFVNYDVQGGVYQLVPSPDAGRDDYRRFPRRLTDTGLFKDTAKHEPAPGVYGFSINAEQWLDHATAARYVALPGTTTIQMSDEAPDIFGFAFNGKYLYPKDGLLAKTISLEMERGKPASRRRLETQVLHFDGAAWRGYTYEWNDAQTDATLVAAGGKDRDFVIKDAKAPGGTRRQRWHFPSRTECLRCHNPWVGYNLAFNFPQLDRRHANGAGPAVEQLRTLLRLGIFRRTGAERNDKNQLDNLLAKLTDPHDGKADLEARARSYLHVNCAHCHQFGAGGSANFSLTYDTPLDESRTLEVRPVQGMFGIKDGQILAPGDPYRSVLYYRMAKLGAGRMPHIGSEVVDEAGLRLIHDWIRRLPVRKDDRALITRLRELDEATALAREKADTPRRVRDIAQELAAAEKRKDPTEKDRRMARERVDKEHAESAEARARGRSEVFASLLQDTSAALMLLRAVEEDRLPAGVRAQALAAATAAPDVQVRDLFERFLPDEKRVRRLGTSIDATGLLALKGDQRRGRQLLLTSAVLCINCHRVGDKGSTLGPELTHVAKKLTRAQILDKVLQPSRTIDPKFVAYLLETTDGKLHTGLLVEKTDRHVLLRTAQDQQVRVPAGEVAALTPLRTSLMPEQLLRDLTAEQAADLLAFLESLK
jgi:putative heme-binding domain-containing protein